MFKHIILLQTEFFTNQPSKQTPGCPRLGLLVNVCILFTFTFYHHTATFVGDRSPI